MAHKSRVMVCVTGQTTCERYIKQGYELANVLNGDIVVVHVAKYGEDFLNSPHEGEALEYLFQVSKSMDASMSVLRSGDPALALCNYAVSIKATHVIMGQAQEVDSIAKRLTDLLTKIKIKINVIASD